MRKRIYAAAIGAFIVILAAGLAFWHMHQNNQLHPLQQLRSTPMRT